MTPQPPQRTPVPAHAGVRVHGPGGWFAAGLVLCALLTSCSVLGNKPAPPLRTFTLASAVATPVPSVPNTRAPNASALQTSGQRVLLVDVPHAAPGYDSARMVYVRQPQTQEAFANSVWADTPARLLAPLLVARLQQGGQFRAVLLAPSAAKAHLRLDTTLLHLQQDFLHVPSVVRLGLQVSVMDNTSREVLAWRSFEVVQTAASDDAPGGASAAQDAVQEGLRQVVDFLQTAVLD